MTLLAPRVVVQRRIGSGARTAAVDIIEGQKIFSEGPMKGQNGKLLGFVKQFIFEFEKICIIVLKFSNNVTQKCHVVDLKFNHKNA